MSQENVEIVRQAYESVEGRDWDRMAGLVDPDVEMHGTVGGLEEGHVAHGLSQIRHVFEKDEEIWDDQRTEPQRIIDAGDQVVVLQREFQRGKASGVELVTDTAVVLDLRDGRIVRMQGYMDRAGALKAVGLSEQDAHA
jgi:ketosteroid isomerase-like protein